MLRSCEVTQIHTSEMEVNEEAMEEDTEGQW